MVLDAVPAPGGGSLVTADLGARRICYTVAEPGEHWITNSLAVMAAVGAAGGDLGAAGIALAEMQGLKGRGQRHQLSALGGDGSGRALLIDESYNANPASMAASLDVLAIMPPRDGVGRIEKGRRIAILGDMLELGLTEAALHAAIAETPGLAAIDLIHCVGPRMKALHAALPRGQRGDWVATAAELVPRARHLIDAGDIILVKGSKGIKVSLMVDALRKLGQPAAAAQGDA